jgi:hypothetical protein
MTGREPIQLMPHPLSNNRYPKNAGVLIGPGFLDLTSPFAADILSILVFWPYAETQTGNLFVQLLGPEASRHIERFINRASTRRYGEMLLAMAESRLSPGDLISLRAIIAMYIAAFEERNRLAHWLCGVSPEVPRGVLLINPHDLWRHKINFDDHMRATPLRPVTGTPMLNKRHLLVYERSDFEKAKNNQGAVIKALVLMQALLNSPHTELGMHVRGQLDAIAEFRRAKESLRDPRRDTKSLRWRFARLRRQLSRAFREFLQRAPSGDE